MSCMPYVAMGGNFMVNNFRAVAIDSRSSFLWESGVFRLLFREFTLPTQPDIEYTKKRYTKKEVREDMQKAVSSILICH